MTSSNAWNTSGIISCAECQDSDVLQGFQLLVFRRFQREPSLWYEWRDRLWRKINSSSENGSTSLKNLRTSANEGLLFSLGSLEELGIRDLHQDMWYLSVMLHRRPQQLVDIVRHEIGRERLKRYPKFGETLLTRFLNLNNFTVLSLDSMFKFGDDNTLPKEIFCCKNVKQLSLKYNSLTYLPCDIGRMSNLEYLALTNNKLSVWSLPYSLIFLKRLHTLLLDNNLLDALPGFLLSIPSLKTVHRHGNHNYFKSTFMWYHTDVNLRIIPMISELQPYDAYRSLKMWSAKSIIGLKCNFYEDESIIPELKDYFSEIYHLFNICYHCNNAFLSAPYGYKVITFKNPYLGNTCVPFQHWACSMECAKAIEIPARLEQITAARELDSIYSNYVDDCIKKFSSPRAASVFCPKSGESSRKKIGHRQSVEGFRINSSSTKCSCSVS